jgi:alpha-glucuronidase
MNMKSIPKRRTDFKCFISLVIFMIFTTSAFCNNGYELWLNYKPAQSHLLKSQYASFLSNVVLCPNRFEKEISEELERAAEKIAGNKVTYSKKNSGKNGIVYLIDKKLRSLGKEAYKIRLSMLSGGRVIYISSFSDEGLLYATFELIRHMQCNESLNEIAITETPRHTLRLLNHWDDLTGEIERGYAGTTLWNWAVLPQLEQRYVDYARANASIGINGIVLNNVNTDPRILRSDYLKKIAALTDVLRRYNIKTYLSVNFASPMKPSATPDKWKKWGGIGALNTADPTDKEVVKWWIEKTAEVYALIPDLGGYLIKANSEGMPGPQDYGRSHSDGANMLARALKPYKGIVMWRTFVYNADTDPDRAKRPYKEFIELDGKFDDNVILQAKNGPLDFQPLEPVQPIFGAMPRTNVMVELQITQEYLGQSTYLVYLLPMWRDFFAFDTYCRGKGSSMAKVSTGQIYTNKISAIAGVANTGNNENWCGNHFAQANWFAFGRLAWNPDCDDNAITEQWIKMSWNNDLQTLATIKEIMNPTWESFVKSQTPYGLGMTCSAKDHFAPDFPKRANKSWEVSSMAIGNDRTSHGSNYVSQYFESNRSMFDNIETCPEEMLLFFHFVDWNHKMKSGKTLRDEFFEGLQSNIQLSKRNIVLWQSLKGKVDDSRFSEVFAKLEEQLLASQEYYDNGYHFFSKILEN